MDVVFFETPARMRAWLKRRHRMAKELWVGYYKKGSARPSITWPESVDEALCFGWIDGLRMSIDEVSYRIRFTPRKSRSIWSGVNIRRVEELLRQGRMTPAGIRAFEARKENRVGRYSYEQRRERLPAPYEGRLKANAKAWAYWQSQPPSYRKAAGWWVVSAKKEETRERRLEQLIRLSANELRVPQFIRKPQR